MYSFILNIKIVNKAFNEQLQAILTPYDLSLREWGIIYHLSQENCSTLSNIANCWQVKNPSVTPSVQKLEQKKLIVITKGEDKRQKVMRLSDRGKNLYEQINPIIDKHQETWLEGISEEERATTEKVINKFLNNVIK